MSELFHIKEHVVDAQHIREYPRATANRQEDALRLSVKQYIPKSNPNPLPGDVTIVGAHANGFVKELYEPLWEDLLKESDKYGFRIRSIFIADAAWQGQSGVLNEDKLGHDPSWYDHSRDLLYMINQLRDEMPRPLVGIGHSFGGTIVTYVALMHPRLFSTLVLLDPVMQYKGTGPATGNDPLTLSAVRRDLWPSPAEAAAAFHRSKFYAGWDPRVLDRWIAHGVRPTPTLLYPDPAGAGAVTLTSTKHQEVFTYMRPTLQAVDARTGRRAFDRRRLPDVSDHGLQLVGAGRLYRPEVPNVALQLPQLRPGVLWLFGGASATSPPELRREKLELTGVGVGGSGGVAKGRVREYVLEGVGHLVCMDKPGLCAQQAAAWIGPEIERWREEERELESWWRKTAREKQVIDAEWQGFIDAGKKPARKKTSKL